MFIIKQKVNSIFFLFLIFLVPFLLYSNESGGLALHGGYAFETSKKQKNAALYISFFNNSNKDIFINSFSTKVANKTELHDVKVENDIVKMFPLQDIKIKAKSELFLQPGGKHIMLFDLNRKLNDKEDFTLNVHLKDGRVLKTKIMILSKELRKNFLN